MLCRLRGLIRGRNRSCHLVNAVFERGDAREQAVTVRYEQAHGFGKPFAFLGVEWLVGLPSDGLMSWWSWPAACLMRSRPVSVEPA